MNNKSQNLAKDLLQTLIEFDREDIAAACIRSHGLAQSDMKKRQTLCIRVGKLKQKLEQIQNYNERTKIATFSGSDRRGDKRGCDRTVI